MLLPRRWRLRRVGRPLLAFGWRWRLAARSAKTSAKTSHGFVLLIMVFLLTLHGPRVPLDKSLVTDALMKLLSYESQCGATNRQKSRNLFAKSELR